VPIQLHDVFVGISQQIGRLIRDGARRSLLLAVSAALLCQCGAPAGGVHQEVIREGQFAQLHLFQPPGPVRHLLLLSGDGGGGPGLDAIAQRLWWAPFRAAYDGLAQPRPAGEPGP
jgi:hypothetical protein